MQFLKQRFSFCRVPFVTVCMAFRIPSATSVFTTELELFLCVIVIWNSGAFRLELFSDEFNKTFFKLYNYSVCKVPLLLQIQDLSCQVFLLTQMKLGRTAHTNKTSQHLAFTCKALIELCINAKSQRCCFRRKRRTSNKAELLEFLGNT